MLKHRVAHRRGRAGQSANAQQAPPGARAATTDAAIVGSGDAALQAVRDQPPDLIILDLNLPVLSGPKCVAFCGPATFAAARNCRSSCSRRAPARDEIGVAGLDQGATITSRSRSALRELSSRVARGPFAGHAAPRRPAHRPGIAGAHLNADVDAVAGAVDGAPIRLTTRRSSNCLRYLGGREQEPASCHREPSARARLGYERLVVGDKPFRRIYHIDVHVRPLTRQAARCGPADRDASSDTGYRFVD
jgi:hypothetical protein